MPFCGALKICQKMKGKALKKDSLIEKEKDLIEKEKSEGIKNYASLLGQLVFGGFSMKLAAIDPGAKGAICLIIGGAPIFIDIKKDPIAAVREAKTYAPEIWIMEKVGAQRHDGVNSAFSFGQNVGQLEGAIDAPIFYVTPRTWQSWCGVYGAGKGKGTKRKAYDICTTMLGPTLFTGPRGGVLDGRCDAFLIGQWWLENIFKKH